MLSVDDIRHNVTTDARWAIRGLLAIYKNQTTDEQLSETTSHVNGIGFTGADAEILSSFAKKVLDFNPNSGYKLPLSERQMEILFKKIGKYAKQLSKVQKEKINE